MLDCSAGSSSNQITLSAICIRWLPPLGLQKVRGLTGFTPVEVFRKYLWFMLRERKFDVAAVEDMTLLKTVLGLTDDEVGQAGRQAGGASPAALVKMRHSGELDVLAAYCTSCTQCVAYHHLTQLLHGPMWQLIALEMYIVQAAHQGCGQLQVGSCKPTAATG